VVTDGSGGYNGTLQLADLLRGKPSGLNAVSGPVTVAASWLSPSGSLVSIKRELLIAGTDTPVFARMVTSIIAHRPGVPFSISPGRQRPGGSAVVLTTPVSPAACRALSSCKENPADSVKVQNHKFSPISEEEASSLRKNSSVVCADLAIEDDDWSRCRWELPGPGRFAIVVCITRAGSTSCFVTYRCAAPL
jgi:hypothetical protein